MYIKELSLGHKLKFKGGHSLKNLRFPIFGFKDIKIRESEFVAIGIFFCLEITVKDDRAL